MEATLADYISHAPIFVRRLDGEITYWTRGAQDLYGYTPAEANGRISHELLRTEFPEPLERISQVLTAKGQWSGRLEHCSRDGRRIFTESVWRLRSAEGGGVVVEQNIDVTARVIAERQRDLLARELDHRVKNTLAVVQGLARLTFGDADAADVRRFEDRLIALSEAHKVLMRRQWDGAELHEIAGEVLRGINVEGYVTVEGPKVELTAQSAVAYALAFHELATNALKHGALSTADGRVELRWRLSEATPRRVHVTWREIGGPPVSAPTRQGFGLRLIRAALAQELGTPVDLRFEEDGLVCAFDGLLQKSPEAG